MSMTRTDVAGESKRAGASHARKDAERDLSESSTDEDEAKVMTVAVARGTLRDIMTLLERQPQKRQVASARTKAQGDPRGGTLTVIPMVVEVAEEALARHETSRAAVEAKAGGRCTGAAWSDRRGAGLTNSKKPLLVDFLREAQFLVASDPTGTMKRDLTALRMLLSPP